MPAAFEQLIQAYGGGDDSVAPKLVAAFRDSPVTICLSDPPSQDERGMMTVQYHLGTEEGQDVVYAFSSEQIFEAWCQSQRIKPHRVSLIGEHLCRTVGDDTGICIDAGTSTAWLLPKTVVLQIQDGEYVTHPPLKRVVINTALVVSTETEPPRIIDQYQPASRFGAGPGNQGDAPQGQRPPSAPSAPEPKFARRSKPTQFFAAPQAPANKAKPPGTGLAPSRPKTYTSSNLKKIVRPPASSEDES